jgi:hypothetical protein
MDAKLAASKAMDMSDDNFADADMQDAAENRLQTNEFQPSFLQGKKKRKNGGADRGGAHGGRHAEAD